jgi:flagellar biosynthesis/type III secretory pathway protein FliH
MAGTLVTEQAFAAEETTGRYVLQRAGDGFIRLDTVTGATAHCRQKQAAWHCESLSDEQASAREEIATLQAENRKLRRQVESLEARLAQQERKSGSKSGLPSDEEFDRIMEFFDKVMRRFMEFAKTLRDFPGEDA